MNWFKSFLKALNKPQLGEGAKFTPRAQQVLVHSSREADRLNHNFVGTEHLLLGMISFGQGTAVTALRKMGVDLEAARLEVAKQVGTGPAEKMIGNIPYTPRVKKVLALAAKEAKYLNHTYIGTEHILLGLLREGDGMGARVLRTLGVDIERTRQEILRELAPDYQIRKTMDMNPDEKQQSNASSGGAPEAIDINKRYDVYCSERNQQVVVYRNARFKGRSKLVSTRQHEFGGEYLQLEQSNGQTIYLSLHSVVKFCEHGGEFTGEIVPSK